MEPNAPTVIKVSNPVDMLGLLPYRLGFHPQESIVVVCLQGPRQRDAVVMRLDLLDPAQDEAVAQDIVDRVAFVKATSVLLVCYTEASCDSSDPYVRQPLVDALEDRLAERGIDIVDALLVRDGRWWSYFCSGSSCCPLSGTALPSELTPPAQLYAAESVAQGGVLLGDRAELVRSIWPDPCHPVRDGHIDAADEIAAQSLAAALEEDGLPGLRALVLATLRSLLHAWSSGATELSLEDAALVVIGLRDKQARDEAVTLLLDFESEVLLALLVALARSADDGDAAPICTVLAWVAYCRGDGALANVAIERALDCEPGYELARMIESGLDAMVPPSEVRRLTEQVRDDLREQPKASRAARRKKSSSASRQGRQRRPKRKKSR